MTAEPITQLPTRHEPVGVPSIRLLGVLELSTGEAPTAPLIRQLLALLAYRANQVCTIKLISEELWGPTPPRAAEKVIQTYVYHLRHKGDTGIVVETVRGGYKVVLGSTLDVDAHRFDDLIAKFHGHAGAGRYLQAEDALRAASSLWRGDPFEEVTIGPVLDRYAAGLIDRRRSALDFKYGLDLKLGRHRQIVDELAAIVRAEPGREDLVGKLMLALYRSQRRVDSLRVFDEVKAALKREFGVEPCHELKRLRQQVLTGDPALNLNGGAA